MSFAMARYAFFSSLVVSSMRLILDDVDSGI